MLYVYVFSFISGSLLVTCDRLLFLSIGFRSLGFGTSNDFICGLFTLVEAPLSLVFRLLIQFSFFSAFRPAVPWRLSLCFFLVR